MAAEPNIEKPRRLSPKKDAIRQVAALSGNVCAFDGCDHEVIDENGKLVVQLCHIEAAEPGGERFNPAMTNEERRAPQNLMFMCLRHHIETNDTSVWPTERLRELKEKHESNYRWQQNQIPEASITDITEAVALGRPQNMLRFGSFLDRDSSDPLTAEQHLVTLQELVWPMLERFRRLAPETRRLFQIVVDRGEHSHWDLGLRCAELEQVTGLDPTEIKSHVTTMERYEIATLEEGDWEGDWWITTWPVDHHWGFWRDLRDFCGHDGLELVAFIGDLRFDLLDQ
jgi:hypothetical protein